MKRLFGVNSDHFYRLARGIDSRPVVSDRIAKSVSHESTFSHDLEDRDAMRAWLLELTEQVARRIRRHEVRGKTVNLKIRFSDFQTITRAQSLPEPTSSTQEFARVVEEVFARLVLEGRSVRLLGVGISNLVRKEKQQGLLFDGDKRASADRLDSVQDSIKEKFGNKAVRRASSLEHGIRYQSDPRVDDK